jgi:hypothetical protein
MKYNGKIMAKWRNKERNNGIETSISAIMAQ